MVLESNCGMKLLRSSEHFSKSIIDKIAQHELVMAQFTEGNFFRYFHSMLADFFSLEQQWL